MPRFSGAGGGGRRIGGLHHFTSPPRASNRFEYEINDGELKYRWSNVINGFNMPIEINLDNKSIKLFPVMDWKHLKTIEGNLEINKNYYVKSNKIFN